MVGEDPQYSASVYSEKIVAAGVAVSGEREYFDSSEDGGNQRHVDSCRLLSKGSPCRQESGM